MVAAFALAVLLAAHRTPVPRGPEYALIFNFGRVESCPDRIVWRFGMGEGQKTTPLTDEQREDCSTFLVTTRHVFEHSAPRCVVAIAYLGSEEIARASVRWPGGMPC